MLMSRLQDADVTTLMLKKPEMPKNCCFGLFSSLFHPRTKYSFFRFLGQERRWENTFHGVSLSKTFQFFQFFFFLARASFLEQIFFSVFFFSLKQLELEQQLELELELELFSF